MTATAEFAQVLARLRDLSQPFPPRDLYQFSDLYGADLKALASAWPEVDAERRRHLTEDLNEIAEANFEVNFDEVFRVGLEDEDSAVRAASIHGLWESEDRELIGPFLDFMLHDPETNVRAAAASALGRFVYLGEVDDLPRAQARRVEDALLAVVRSSGEVDLRRHALEALAFSARSEVPPLIEAAYADDDDTMRVSALFAMGRSGDPRWAPQVMKELDAELPEFRLEAARATGELELSEAVKTLTALTADEDAEVRHAAIWSLSQVGGGEAAHVLDRLLDEAEDDERDFIEESLDNLALSNDMHNFSLLAFGDGDDEGALDVLNAVDEDEDDDDDGIVLN